jgi:hypothetical protein
VCLICVFTEGAEVDDCEEGAGFTDAVSAVSEEKEVAASAIGEIFEFTGRDFLPFLEDSIITLIELLQHFHEEVRKSSVTSLFSKLL